MRKFSIVTAVCAAALAALSFSPGALASDKEVDVVTTQGAYQTGQHVMQAAEIKPEIQVDQHRLFAPEVAAVVPIDEPAIEGQGGASHDGMTATKYIGDNVHAATAEDLNIALLDNKVGNGDLNKATIGDEVIINVNELRHTWSTTAHPEVVALVEHDTGFDKRPHQGYGGPDDLASLGLGGDTTPVS